MARGWSRHLRGDLIHYYLFTKYWHMKYLAASFKTMPPSTLLHYIPNRSTPTRACKEGHEFSWVLTVSVAFSNFKLSFKRTTAAENKFKPLGTNDLANILQSMLSNTSCCYRLSWNRVMESDKFGCGKTSDFYLRYIWAGKVGPQLRNQHVGSKNVRDKLHMKVVWLISAGLVA